MLCALYKKVGYFLNRPRILAYDKYVRIHKGIEIIISDVFSKWLLFEVTTEFNLLSVTLQKTHCFHIVIFLSNIALCLLEMAYAIGGT